MTEPRKNHLAIDGAQVKEDEHVASYKPIPDSDTAEFRSSKSSLTKSKEKVSPDGAEEKLLQKEDEAKIVRVDMADAKYVVGDHRNGDAKIELDANKRQFSGLTKEELLKYADDPFWVNLRWLMFVLFWTLWVGMLAGAVTIIVRAPTCAPPTPRQWFEKYLMLESEDATQTDLESQFEMLQTNKVEGIFMKGPTYEVLDENEQLDSFKSFAEKAKEYGVKIIVDLTPNFVSLDHPWFKASENRTDPFTDFFIWASGREYDEDGKPKPPNQWVSIVNESAWTYSPVRKQFYLHQYGAQLPDLNFTEPQVADKFQQVLTKWMAAGASGVRLNKARELLVKLNASKSQEIPATGHGAALVDVGAYGFYRHVDNTDLLGLDELLRRMADHVDSLAENPGQGETVFTIKEEGNRAELFLLTHNDTGRVPSLRPPSAAPLPVTGDVRKLADTLARRVQTRWPFLQLKGSNVEEEQELALFGVLLPAAPVVNLRQIDNDTSSESLSDIMSLRSDASVEHGQHAILAAPAVNSTELLLVCARWKPSHTGYVSVYNPGADSVRANLSSVPSVPDRLSVRHLSHNVKLYTNYTVNYSEDADNFIVPAKSTLILSYVPNTTADH